MQIFRGELPTCWDTRPHAGADRTEVPYSTTDRIWPTNDRQWRQVDASGRLRITVAESPQLDRRAIADMVWRRAPVLSASSDASPPPRLPDGGMSLDPAFSSVRRTSQRSGGRGRWSQCSWSRLESPPALANPAYRYCMFPCRTVVLFSIAVGFLRMSVTT